jgi:predicted RNase H-like HicB family nuclease
MNVKIIVHEAEEGGFWAEVPAIPGCVSQADSMPELLDNIRDAIEACLSATPGDLRDQSAQRIVEVAV